MHLRHFTLSLLRRWVDFYYDRHGPIRVLFLVRNRLGCNYLTPLLLEMERRGHFHLAITLEFDGCMDLPNKPDERALFDRYYIPNATAVWRKWHYVILTDKMSSYFKFNMVKVVIQHGNAFGNSEGTQCGHLLEILKSVGIGMAFLGSPNTWRAVTTTQAGRALADRLPLFISGLSKLDGIVNTDRTNGVRFLRSLGLSPERKTIILTSHWSDKAVIPSLGRELIDVLVSMQDRYNIIITGHEKLWHDPAYGGPAASAELRSYLHDVTNMFENVRVAVMLDDSTDLLWSGDVFICDNSSIVVEICIVDKPIIFFNNPQFVFGNQEVGELFTAVGPNFSRADQVAELCTAALEQPDNHGPRRARIRDFFLTRPGHATSYMADIIAEAGRLSGPRSPGWPRLLDMSKRELARAGLGVRPGAGSGGG